VVEHRRSTVPGDGLCLCWITGGRACMFLASGRCALLVSAPICEYHEREVGELTMHCAKDAVEEILLMKDSSNRWNGPAITGSLND